MTNKEAIKMLIRLKDQINFEWTDAQKKIDALNAAIKALSLEQTYFIQLKDIVSNDEFEHILEGLKQQCNNIVLLPEYVQFVYPAEHKEKALLLLLDWAIECGFGYDNIPEEYAIYEKDIENMGYKEGLIYIAEREVGRVSDAN